MFNQINPGTRASLETNTQHHECEHDERFIVVINPNTKYDYIATVFTEIRDIVKTILSQITNISSSN